MVNEEGEYRTETLNQVPKASLLPGAKIQKHAHHTSSNV